MARHTQHNDRKRGRTIVAVSFAVAGLAITGAGVFAGLNATATNTTAEAVNTGTLQLEMSAATGAASITTAVSNLAPGDVDNRYIVLANTGTLSGKNLGLSVTDSTPTVLSTSASKGLSVSVTRCSGPYIAATGFCSAAVLTPAVPGVETTYLAKTSLSALGTKTNFAGPINPAAGTDYNLKVSVHADGTETVVNGALPVGTMQGLTANLTYTFAEDQRDGVTTNS